MVTLPSGGVAAAINKGFSVQALVSKARTACLSPKLPPLHRSNLASGNVAFGGPTHLPKKIGYPGSQVIQEATECADDGGGGVSVSGWGQSPQVME